jgi:hypothetical protein
MHSSNVLGIFFIFEKPINYMNTQINTNLFFSIFLLSIFISFNAKAIYIPVAVSGYNADVVADIQNDAFNSTNNDVDGVNYVFMTQSYNPLGSSYMPITGLFTSVVPTTPGLTYQLASYTQNNSLRLSGATSGALTFNVPQAAQSVFVLGASGSGTSTANITVNFTDLTSQVFPAQFFADWYNGANFAIQGLGRTNRTTNAIANDASNPRLYQLKLDLLPANYGKTIQNITFDNTGAVLNIMGISIDSPPVPYDPAVTSISSPSGNCYTANQVISVQVCNYGMNAITLSTNPINVTLNVNGPLGLSQYYYTLNSGILPGLGASCMNAIFTGVNMYAGGTYYLNTTLNLNGLTNSYLANDSLSSPVVKINFRPTAGAPYNLCQYSQIPFGQGLTVSGCATPIQDSVTLTFQLQPTTNPSSTTPTGAAYFAKAALPSLPLGSTIGVCEYKVTNLATTAGGWANETRFPLFYGGMPVQLANLLYNSSVGNAALSSSNYTWTNNSTALTNAVGLIYATLNAGDTLKMGYHSTWGGNSTTNGYTLNAGAPTEATLKIRYTYVPASFEWYSVPSGGINLYSFSPFNPLITTGSGLSNSNTPNTYTWFAACSGSSNCRVPVNLVINPVPQVIQDTLAMCESSTGSNSAIFDLTSMDGAVSAFAPGVTIQYFGDQGLFTPVATPSNDTTSTNFKYSKVTLPTGCFSTDSLLLQVNFQPELPTSVITSFACAPNSIDITQNLGFITSPAGTDTLYYSDPGFTIPFTNPTSISNADTVYIVLATNTNPVCSDTAVAYIDILPAGSLISAQAGTFPIYYSNAGNYGCTSVSYSDGMSDTIRSTVDCRRIAAVTDINNSISLGNVSACQDIAASTPYHNGQPYVNRAYQITAANSDTAMVCLYYLDQDFQDYNADAGFTGWPLLPVSGGPANLSNIAVTKVDNGDLNTPGHTAIAIPNSAINASYDPNSTVWTICFPVSGFSYFYLHTQNPVNAPLPVTMLSFAGKSVDGTSQLNWITATEQNNSHFVVERSKDGRSFSTISNAIASKANNGTSETPLDYGYTDATPFQGHNYYRLQQHDIDGKTSYSNVVDVYFGNETMITLYPNPVNSLLNVDINTPKATSATLKVTDATGRVVKVVSMQLSAGANTTQVDLQGLADGMYMIHITNGKGLDYAQPVRKN